MIDPTFPETCDVLIDVVRLFSGDIIAFPYCCVKYSGSFGDVKCSPGSATQFFGDITLYPWVSEVVSEI